MVVFNIITLIGSDLGLEGEQIGEWILYEIH